MGCMGPCGEQKGMSERSDEIPREFISAGNAQQPQAASTIPRELGLDDEKAHDISSSPPS